MKELIDRPIYTIQINDSIEPIYGTLEQMKEYVKTVTIPNFQKTWPKAKFEWKGDRVYCLNQCIYIYLRELKPYQPPKPAPYIPSTAGHGGYDIPLEGSHAL